MYIYICTYTHIAETRQPLRCPEYALQHTAIHTATHISPVTAETRQPLRCPEYALQHCTTHCNILQKKLQNTFHQCQLKRASFYVARNTHCNTLQHNATRTATHMSLLPAETRQPPPCPEYALQHTATHCNTLQHTLQKHFTNAG